MDGRTLVRHYREAVSAPADGRTVSGVAVRLGEVTTLWPGFEEVFDPGCRFEFAPAANLTVQHDRSQPIGLPDWAVEDGSLRVSSAIPAGARQDQALADIRAGLLRGLSLEFFLGAHRVSDTAGGGERVTILEALVAGVSVVDSPAYSGSSLDRERALIRSALRGPRGRADRERAMRRGLCASVS